MAGFLCVEVLLLDRSLLAYPCLSLEVPSLEELAEWMELLDRGPLEELELDCLKKLLLEVDHEGRYGPNFLLHAFVLPTLGPVVHALDSLALLLLEADDPIDELKRLLEHCATHLHVPLDSF